MVDFLNLQPGPLSTTAIRPNQKLYFGLKGDPSDCIDLSMLTLAAGFTNIKKHLYLPEEDTSLAKYASVSLETSERRRPITGQSSISETSGVLRIERNSSNLGDQSVYEISAPVGQTDSILASISFKKAAWATVNPDWCSLSNLTGLYFGVEHGAFNTAAYAFLRDDGTNGSVVFGGPLQSYSLARPGQSEEATNYYGPDYPGVGWKSFSNGTVLTLFLRINTYTAPYTAELWTYAQSSGHAPCLQATVPLTSLGVFPSKSFSNGRSGVSDTARLVFGNLGANGSVLEVVDWRLYNDFPVLVNAGQASPVSALERASDAATSYNIADNLLPIEGYARRWFYSNVSGYASPVLALTPRRGVPSKSAYLSVNRTNTQPALLSRQEPASQPGSMIEAFMHLSYSVQDGELVGPGLVVNNALGSFILTAITNGSNTIGLLKDGGTPTEFASYYTPESAIDLSTPKLVRLITDSDRSRVTIEVDEESVLELPIGLANAKMVSGAQGPFTALSGETLSMEDDDANIFNYAFGTNPTSIADLVLTLNSAFPGDFIFYDYGTKFGIEFLHSNKSFKILNTGAIGTGALNLATDEFAVPSQTNFPAAPSQGFAFNFGFPFSGAYDAELRVNSVLYAKYFHEWRHSYLLLPDNAGQPSEVQFTLAAVGTGASTITDSGLVIEKLDFSGAGSKREYRRDIEMAGNGSALVDFEMQVQTYTDSDGTLGASSAAVGAGVTIYLGTKKLTVNVYDCGVAGKRIGVIPGSGSDLDIVNQTALGAAFSANVDWSKMLKYRVSVEPYKSIKIWSGTVLQDPIITIPWRNDTDGFDLPTDVSSTGLGFGHLDCTTSQSSSTTIWKTIRWAFGTGFDIAASRQFSDEIPSSAFGGKSLILTTLV